MVVVWRVTEQCNLGCCFCAYDRALQRPRREVDGELIRAFGPILAEFQEKTGQQVLVAWHGGEPLLWEPLAALATEFRRRHNLRVSTTTNGTPLASAALRAHLIREYDELTISVDAPGTDHDLLRDWPDGFAQLRQNVIRLVGEIRQSGSGLKLRANVVLMRRTIGRFEELCRELAGWGIREVTFNQLGGIDRPEFYPYNRLLPEQVERLAVELPGLRRELAALGVTVRGGDGYLDRFRASAADRRIRVEKCTVAERFLFIDQSGMVAPCSFTVTEFGLPLAEITSARELAGLAANFAEKQRQRPAAACTDCHCTQLFNKFCEV